MKKISAGESISVSKKCGMSASGLHKRRDMIKDRKRLIQSTTSLNNIQEMNLAKCVGTMCNL